MHDKQEIRLLVHPRYDIRWVGHCQYDNSDKIWGWFIYNDPTADKKAVTKSYAFWARTGKTPSFKVHTYSTWNMDKLVREKKDRKYNEITVEKLVGLWPSFFEDIDNRFIFFMLVGD